MQKHYNIVIISIFITLTSPCFSSAHVEEYRVGVGDLLDVTIFGNNDYRFNQDVKVSQAGNILISMMQKEMHVSGLTIQEIDQMFTEILAREYLVDPEVIIQVKEYHSHKILVVGAVKSSGELVIERETIPLRELLVQMGGPLGDMNKMVVIIHAGRNRDPEIIQLDQLLMERSSDVGVVGSDDVVYIVDKDNNLPIQDIANVIYVFGEVSKPGLIPYSKGLTTLRAILNAGNFTAEAAPGRTFIKRHDGKKINKINVDLQKVMSGGDKTVDIPVLPGDVVYVPRAIF